MIALIPMAGEGSRFKEKGYTFPKPLIDVKGKTMIQWVIENIDDPLITKFIFLVRSEHLAKYDMHSVFNAALKGKSFDIIPVCGLTGGAACTTLMAKDLINNEEALVIANADQYLDWLPEEKSLIYKKVIDSQIRDSVILTFNSSHPKWSYVKTDNNYRVKEVVEKKVISNDATVGIYIWRQGKMYVEAAEAMIEDGFKVNGEFYVAPAYNYAIQKFDRNVFKANILTGEKVMWGLGTPEDLEEFLRK